MSQAQGFYLGKGGEKFGPFTDEQIKDLRASGELFSYSWIWDSRDPSSPWKPIDPPPSKEVKAESVVVPPPVPSDKRKEVTRTREVESPQPTRTRFFKSEGFEAACHDHKSLVTGSLHQVSENGCELVVSGGSPDQCFTQEGEVLLNILNPKTGKSMTVVATMAKIARTEGNWTYRLQWEECPEILRTA